MTLWPQGRLREGHSVSLAGEEASKKVSGQGAERGRASRAEGTAGTEAQRLRRVCSRTGG